jgi:hypothetical protein
MAKEIRQPGAGRPSVYRVEDLKVCDLCGHLNLNTNAECFVCGWHGHFEQTPEVIHPAMEAANRRYGRLELQHLTDLRTYQSPVETSVSVRFRMVVRRFWNWLCG